MKAVLDTNVLISAVISTGTSHQVVVEGFEGEYTIVLSPDILGEFERTLSKYPDKFALDDDEINRERDTFEYFSEIAVPEVEIDAVEDDPSDDIFLEAAVAGDADYVVSGDSHLLDVTEFRGIRLVSPDEFLESL